MIDIGLSKLMLIGVVALVVIGPEKLPRVARTAGTLLGRAQRYVNDVKAEVSQQMDIDELKRVKTHIEDAARNVESTVSKNLHETSQEINATWKGDDATADSALSADAAGLPPAISDNEKLPTVVQTPSVLQLHAQEKLREQNRQAQKQKRADEGSLQKNWRAQRYAMPLWYRRRTRMRCSLRSSAARHARQSH